MFEVLFENSRDIVLFMQLDGKIVHANQSAVTAYGYELNELLSRNISDLRYPDTRSFIKPQIEEANVKGTVFETVHLRKNGQAFPVEVSSHKTMLDDKPVLLSIIRDISERKKTENLIKESEKLYRNIVEISPNMFAIHNMEKFIFINTAGIKLLGAKNAEEVYNKQFLDIVHPDFQIPVLERLRTMSETGESVSLVERKLVRFDGKTIDVEVAATPIFYKGRNTFLILVRDITRRKALEAQLRLHQSYLEDLVAERTNELMKTNERLIQQINKHQTTLQSLRLSEERFSKIFNASPGLMSINTFSEGTFIHVNENFARYTGYSREEVLGRTVEQLSLCADLANLKSIKRQLLTNGNVSGFEVNYYTKDGILRTGILSAEIIPLEGEQCTLTVINDITSKKQMEKEITRLDQLNLVGEMAASIGHEIRNPMTTVRGFLQMFCERKIYDRDRQFFQLMIDELDRANSIIKNFLSLAKNKVSNKKTNNLNRIITTIHPLIDADALVQDKLVRVELNDIPNLLLDENEIRQLILNLVRNGLEAMQSKGTVIIKTHIENKKVVLKISDEGKGIDPKILENIGIPFFTTKEHGTGLGLPVCYSIASRHNASIKLKTGKKGTTFFIIFE